MKVLMYIFCLTLSVGVWFGYHEHDFRYSAVAEDIVTGTAIEYKPSIVPEEVTTGVAVNIAEVWKNTHATTSQAVAVVPEAVVAKVEEVPVIQEQETGFTEQNYDFNRDYRNTKPVSRGVEVDRRPFINMPKAHQDALTQVCRYTGVNIDMVYALIRAESTFNNKSVSDSGCIGYCQMSPSTFSKTLKNMKKTPYYKAGSRGVRDPIANITVCVFKLRELANLHPNLSDEQMFHFVMTAYNRGGAGANALRGQGYKTSYSKKVWKYYQQYKNKSRNY